MTETQMYLVGGAVRDELLGVRTKDYDYTVIVPDAPTIEWAWTGMREHLEAEGFKIFLETPEYFTIRAQFPKGHPNARTTADFVLSRKDGPYSDGRRPDWVEPGTLEDDIFRRDFTVNALAKDGDGTIIDLVNGRADLDSRILRAVGDPLERMKEDALRVFRAVRFSVTKGFTIDPSLRSAMKTFSVLDALHENIAAERIKDELHKCFAFHTPDTMRILVTEFPELLGVMYHKGIWVEPTMKTPKG